MQVVDNNRFTGMGHPPARQGSGNQYDQFDTIRSCKCLSSAGGRPGAGAPRLGWHGGNAPMIWHDVARCRSPLVRELHGFWAERRGPARVPNRADIDPAEITGLLPNLLIVDFEPEPFRVRYRLVGTRVVAASGYDFTGRYLDEMNLASGAELWASYYRKVRELREPLFGAVALPTAGGGGFSYEFGIFPLTTDGANVTQCLDIEDYGQFNERLIELQEKVEHWRPQPITARAGGR
jgi:hypothetical protein